MDERASLAAIRRGYIQLSAAVARLADSFGHDLLEPYYVRLGRIRRSLEDMGDAIHERELESELAAASGRHLAALSNSIYLARLDVHIEKANLLVREQRARVRTYRLAGILSQPSLDLLANMTRSMELLHWQRALALWAERDPDVNRYALQRSATAQPPANVLALVCAELDGIEVPTGTRDHAAKEAASGASKKATEDAANVAARLALRHLSRGLG